VSGHNGGGSSRPNRNRSRGNTRRH
jgi:hypothetical protein